MARIHAKRKGRSGSKRPFVKENPEWVPLEADEVVDTVVKLQADGLSTAEIGVRLRDGYAVPNVRLATGKSVMQVLQEKGVKIDLPEDLANLMRRAVRLQGHLKANSADLSNRRGLQLTEAKIRRLVRYYKDRGVVAADWDYSLKLAELQVK